MNNLRGVEVISKDGRFTADNTTKGHCITMRIGHEEFQTEWEQFKHMYEMFAACETQAEVDRAMMKQHGSDLTGCTETGIPVDSAPGMDKVSSEVRKG